MATIAMHHHARTAHPIGPAMLLLCKARSSNACEKNCEKYCFQRAIHPRYSDSRSGSCTSSPTWELSSAVESIFGYFPISGGGLVRKLEGSHRPQDLLLSGLSAVLLNSS
ncbi:MAG TPA: hypothetical protein VKA18_09380 [Alphaproteobacteria bacterium]|nr:hypothetical protein [Alphaproteobacteria bacterium]